MITLLHYSACLGPDGCGKNRAVVWQGDCGCWVFKCLVCGVVDHVDCGREAESHWDEFEAECMASV